MEAIPKVDIDRFLDYSMKIQVEDLDWDRARAIGLTAEERFILTYFADIESQTIIYLRDILNTEAALDPDVMSFLPMWNYEEFFHGRSLAQFLSECGAPLSAERPAEVRRHSELSEKLIAWAGKLFSKFLPKQFVALYMTWGAINELTTLRGYESIRDTTPNPVLSELCERIAKQERRHFAWYFKSAEQRLKHSHLTQRIVRKLLERVWTPVGAGVKSKEEVFRLMRLVFPARGEIPQEIDRRISDLPGLNGISLMEKFWGLAQGGSWAG